MKFISKLYFNIFKRIGNLRLMFVVSCFFALSCCWWTYSVNYKPYVHLYNDSTDINIVEKNLENLSKYKSGDLSRYTAVEIAKVESFYFYRLCKSGTEFEIDTSGTDLFKTVGNDVEKFCNTMPEEMSFYVYSFSTLWNYLWVIFWFYFPFLIVLPIKFIVDGYSEDKKDKK